MKKLTKDINQPQTPKLLAGHLSELIEHPGRKIIEKELKKLMGDIKGKLWLPCTDESMRFNSRNLLNERLTSLFVLSKLPEIMLSDLREILKTDSEQQKPVIQRLEDTNKKLSDELLKYIKL